MDLLATSGDITISWTSPMLPILYSNDTTINPLPRPITESEDAWIGSLLTLGAIVGSIIFSSISDKFGMKIGLLTIGLPHIISYLTLAFSRNVYWFCFARFIAGLALGGGYCLLPTYIAEISKETERGTLSQTLNIFWAIGNFIPFAVGPFIPVMWFNLFLATIPITFFIVFSIFGTESPYYYVKHNKIGKAEQSLMLLRAKGLHEVQKELNDIKKFVKTDEHGCFRDLFKDRIIRKSFFVCLVLIATQDLSGFCAITFHLQLIFEEAGTRIGSDFAAMIVGTALIVSSFIAPVLVDKAGRRLLTITSCFGMSIAHFMIGSFFYVKDLTTNSTTRISWIPIFSLILYIVSFNFGICSVPWTLVAELFPNKVKQVATISISSTCWVVSFVMTSSFNKMNDTFGQSGTFWFFAASCLAAATFSITFVPETKGKSFIEIQEMLNFGSVKNVNDIKDNSEDEKMLHNSTIKT